MSKNWHYVFLVLAFLFVLFPPVVAGTEGMRTTTKFVFIFSPVASIGPNPYNWPILFALEAACLTAFAVISASKRSGG